MPASAPPPPSNPPLRIPPSVGGSGLSIVAGLLLGRNFSELWVLENEVPPGAWLVPVVMLAFVVALIHAALVARAKMGVVVDPSSVRRQWLIIGIALTMGLVAGGALPFLQAG